MSKQDQRLIFLAGMIFGGGIVLGGHAVGNMLGYPNLGFYSFCLIFIPTLIWGYATS